MHHRACGILKPMLEVLAGIPTVVYGYFALTLMTPLLRSIFGVDRVEIYNVGSAGLVIGILILPLITSMSEDALHAVPRSLREAAYGLGATRLETAVKIVVPAALSGLAAAFIVGISRAIGETMVVALAAGAGPRNFTGWGDAVGGLKFMDPFKAAETMTGHIVRISGGDLSYDSLDYDSLFAIGLVLFAITFVLNLISRWIVRRFRRRSMNIPADDYPEGEDGGRYVRPAAQRYDLELRVFWCDDDRHRGPDRAPFQCRQRRLRLRADEEQGGGGDAAVGDVRWRSCPGPVEVLQKKVSKGVSRLESEKPLAERDRRELYELVLARVVQAEMVEGRR